MSAASKKSNKKKPVKTGFPLKAISVVLAGIMLLLAMLLWSSLFKAYPVEGKKQMLAIGAGDTYSGFIDRLAKDKQVSFPIILKLYQKINGCSGMIHLKCHRCNTLLRIDLSFRRKK